MGDRITLLHSMRVDSDGEVEPGRTCWFRDNAAALAWMAGDGDPCEHRWGYVVLLSSDEGMGLSGEPYGWWRAVYDEDVLSGFDLCPSPLPVGVDIVALGTDVDVCRSG